MILAHNNNNNNNNNKEAKDLIQEKKKYKKLNIFTLIKMLCLNCLCNNLLFFIKICISNQIRK